jgi:hypothetical protein
MYVIDLRHYLNDKGAIARVKGPARKMTEFVTAVVSAMTDLLEKVPGPSCIKCRNASVRSGMARDGAVVWICPKCHTEGRISYWEGSFWDHDDHPNL